VAVKTGQPLHVDRRHLRQPARFAERHLAALSANLRS
jgi:hypothetical protein